MTLRAIEDAEQPFVERDRFPFVRGDRVKVIKVRRFPRAYHDYGVGDDGVVIENRLLTQYNTPIAVMFDESRGNDGIMLFRTDELEKISCPT